MSTTNGSGMERFKMKEWIQQHDFGLSWCVWCLFGLAVVMLTLHKGPDPGNVCGVYLRAGEHFLAGTSLYAAGEFLYFPTAALFFTPFTAFPFFVGAGLWRLFNIAVFCSGIFSLASMKDAKGQGGNITFLVVTIVVCLLSSSAAKHGQMTLMMAGLLMHAAVGLEQSSPWRAAFFMILAIALKPIALPFMMLAFVAYPSVRWRIFASLPFFVLLPFLLNDFGYVLQQYKDVPGMLEMATNREFFTDRASLFGVMQTFGLTINESSRLATRVFLAAAALGVYFYGKNRIEKPSGRCLYLYAISIGYILLLSPGTERNTYAMFTPVIGFLLIGAHSQGHRIPYFLVQFVVAAFLLSHSMKKLFPDSPLSMLKPIATLIVIAIILNETFKKLRPVQPKV